MTKMTENLPARTTTTDVATWDDLPAFDDGSEAFVEHFGLSMPRLRSDRGKGGKGWVDDLTGEVIDAPKLVVLAVPGSRTFWERDLSESPGGEAPDCYSRVHFAKATPDDDVSKRQHPDCTTCAQAQWNRDDDTGANLRPRCAEAINLFAYDTERESYFWARISGTGIREFRNYFSALAVRRRPIYSVVTEVHFESMRDGAREWLVPKFSLGAELTPADVAPHREVARKAMEGFTAALSDLDHGEASETGGGGTEAGTVDMGPGQEPF